MPLLFKLLIDGLAPQPSERPVWEWLPWALIVGYVLLRMSAALISEFRESVVIYVTQNVIQDVYKLIGKYSEKIVEIVIWEKDNPMPCPGFQITNAVEYFIVLGDEPLRSNRTYTKNTIHSSVNSKMGKIYKAVMNQDIADYFISTFTKEGESVLDCFLGLGTTGIACNTKLEPECENIKSWKDLFTGNFANVNAMKDQVEVVSAALRASGTSAADLCTTDTAKYIAAEELLAGFKPAVIDNDGGNERMITGQASIRQSWNGDTHRMKMGNPDIIFIYPSEGLNFWSDHMAIPVGAPNLDNAKIFMNWMMDPANMAAASNFSGYNNAITGTSDLMDDELKNDPAVIVPAEFSSLLSPVPNCGEEARELYTQVFTTWLDSQ
jgi:ABC-type Fe3+ transport system substrate-binding protein